MSHILARMPEVWIRMLDEHVPDTDNLCCACRDHTGAAHWPCMVRRIAEEAQVLYRGGH